MENILEAIQDRKTFVLSYPLTVRIYKEKEY